MGGYANAHPVFLFEMLVQSLYAGRMIWMNVSQDYLSRGSSFREQLIDILCQRLLLIFIWRTWIDDEQLFRRINQITVRVRRRRLRRGACRKANVVRMKLHPACRFAVRFPHREKPLNEITAQTFGQSSHRVQHGWDHDDLASLPLRVRVEGRDPFAALEFRIFRYVRLLLWRAGREKEPGVKPSRCERRGQP